MVGLGVEESEEQSKAAFQTRGEWLDGLSESFEAGPSQWERSNQ